MQSGNRRFRVAVAVLATCLVVALSGFASPAYGGSRNVACETDTTLTVAATAAYDYGDARYLDGIISNESTAIVNCPVVEVRWLEDPERDPEQAWPRADGMAPGDWTTFHLSWPDERAQHVDRCRHGKRLPDGSDCASAAGRCGLKVGR